MELKLLICLVLCAFSSLARCADAACPSADCDVLHTSFFSVSKPSVSFATDAGREGTTRIRLELGQGQVSTPMPIVTITQDSLEGLTHTVVHTWQFLKDFALQHKAVATLNDKAVGQPRRYPNPINSVRTASVLQHDTAAAATATSRRLLDTHTSLALQPPRIAPINVLLLTSGSSIGAVADIMDAVMLQCGDDDQPTITLTLDVVHTPHITSELQKHPKQTLDSHAHYHYFTPASVTLNAAKFLAMLKTSAGGMADLHVFAKLICPPDPSRCFACPNGSPAPSPIGTSCTNLSCPGQGQCSGAGIGSEYCLCPACTPDPSICKACNGFTPVAAPPQTPCTGPGRCAGATCDGSAGNATACKCPNTPPPECVSGQVCRAAVGQCDVEELCVDGACPANRFKLNGARCSWYPSSHRRHGPYSVDLSSARAVKVSPEEAAARLSRAPSYLGEWPSCEGSCINGRCALRWDHPACCGIRKKTHFGDGEEGRQLAAAGAEEGIAQVEGNWGHWEGPEWYCWD